jgi:CRP-like cAMP-binding protein/nitroimidazol reductase NimA-like FMN-containing flavoprotein (pyridoxamine 5'-phosphate oxidase superfamily)
MAGDQAALDVPQHVLDYLGAQKTLTLATASPAGVPKATTLTYVNDGVALYVWTRPDTTTARHVEENPVVSFAIDEYAEDWRQTKGIQGTADAQVVLAPAEVRKAMDLFRQKYSAVGDSTPSNISFFRISPTELRFIDNTSAAGGTSQAVGIAYPSDIVYSVFRDLPQEDVSTVVASMQTMEVETGTVIVRQGAPADKFFILVDGEVEVIREDDGNQRTLAHLSRGQFFGEMAILRDTPREATVRAVVPTTLFALDRDAFRGLVAQSLGTTQDFDRVIHQRLEEIQSGAGG